MTLTHNQSSRRIWMWGYLLIALAVALLIWTGLFAGTPLVTAVRLIFLAIAVLSLRLWTGALLFLICQLQFVALEPRSQDFGLHLDSWFWCALSFVLLATVSRYRTLQDRDYTAAHRSLFHLYREGGTELEPSRLNPAAAAFGSGLLRTGGVLLGCAVAAWFLLSLFPTSSTVTGMDSRAVYGLKPNGYRLIAISIISFAGFIVLWLAINELTWNRLTKSQARVYLNSVMLHFLHRDFRNVARARLKRRRRSRRRSATETNPE